jgi:hypothetical protein
MGRICKAEGCNRPAAKGRHYCNPCRNQKEKESDLAAWAFRKLKSNCKRRRKAAPDWKKSHYDFLIDLPYFREWCVETEILLGRGIYAHSLSIDRIREELGYRPGNLRKLTVADNTSKEMARRKSKGYDWELAYRLRNGLVESEEQASANVFYFYTHNPEAPVDEEPPF